ncbi:MAG: hypothetical protein HUJ51_06280 [Eggerthellaceae bacterium]|nr:hypothetical protein [Eggerthellaceae bacterium]
MVVGFVFSINVVVTTYLVVYLQQEGVPIHLIGLTVTVIVGISAIL